MNDALDTILADIPETSNSLKFITSHNIKPLNVTEGISNEETCALPNHGYVCH